MHNVLWQVTKRGCPCCWRCELVWQSQPGFSRRERQTVFNSLLQQGLKPRWRKGVEIEFFSAGGWIQHDFEYFGG